MGVAAAFSRGRRLRSAATAAVAAVALAAFCFLLSFDRRGIALPDDTIFVDRGGAVLRHVPDAAGLRHLWTPIEDAPAHLVNAFLAAEDSRFYSHPGFDALGMLRALRDNVSSGRIVSGASTITQQLCRIVYPRKRTYADKLIEALRAARIELYMSKAEILEQYLNRVPMGNNIQGVGLASRIYFGHDAGELGIAEAALLASLPKAPGRLNPLGGDIERLRQRQLWVLGRMLDLGYITKKEHDDAAASQPRVAFMEFPFLAPHAVDMMLGGGATAEARGTLRTTLDSGLQLEVERILLSHRERLRYMGARQAAALVVRNRGVQALAHAGSMEYSARDGGYNDGASALRSAGSTLKPVLYALALERGFTAATVVDDVLRKYRSDEGDYAPLNFDRKQYGPVTLRAALGNSLNISAIKVLDQVGIESFYERLKEVGLINRPQYGPEHYGLGLVIGNPEVSLRQLVAAYAMFANGGRFSPVSYAQQERDEAHEIFSEQTAYIVSDMLADPAARSIAFGSTGAMDFQAMVSLKTGTSTGYRDAWAVGYTDDFTVGVWVGNFEGDPTFSTSGAAGAAPILKDVFELIYKGRPATLRQRPQGVITSRVCGISGMEPGPGCMYVKDEIFIEGTEPEAPCSFHSSAALAFTHSLPMEYAPWVYAKNLRGTAAGYRLVGFNEPLDEVFGNQAEEPRSINVRGLPAAQAKRSPAGPVEGHQSIGSGEMEDLRAGGRIEARLVSPGHGERYLLGSGAEASLLLEASATGPAPYLDWFVDGEYLRRTPPPYQTAWRMSRGRHEIAVVTPEGSGDMIWILVE